MHGTERSRPAAILAVAALVVVSLGAAADPNPLPNGCTGPDCALPAATDAPQDTVLELLGGAQALLQKAIDGLKAEAQPQVDAAMKKVEEAKATVEAAARAKAREALLAPPERIWTSLNDGTGSGLDADYLDSMTSGDFIKMVKDEEAARAAGDAAVAASIPDEAWGTVLARDGAGSGLDADRIDGLDSSAFYRAGSKVVDADSLDGLDSSQFYRAGSKVVDADRLDGLDAGQFLRSDQSSYIDGYLVIGAGILDLLNRDWSGGAHDNAGIRTYNTLSFYSTCCGFTSAGNYGIRFSPRDGGAHFKGSLTADGHIFAHSGSHIGDVAEPVAGLGLEPGDVVVSDGFTLEGKLRVAKASEARSRGVVGVVSTDPSLVLAGLATDTPLAVSGIVPVKVVGPVARDDLLATSATPGHATACRDPVACYGAIVGKAVEGFHGAGTGVVRAMVSLG